MTDANWMEYAPESLSAQDQEDLLDLYADGIIELDQDDAIDEWFERDWDRQHDTRQEERGER